jgi:xylulokinase
MGLQLNIDLGTSFIKVSVVDLKSGEMICQVQYPDTETEIISTQPGWAEQAPLQWWENICKAILLTNSSAKYDPGEITSIGIAYQMHGLVVVNKEQRVLRNAIIWCDSRATDKKLYPFGNFTAGKLAWIKNNEPEIYSQIDKILLPGDYIGMKLTGEISTTRSALSEGMFIDLATGELNDRVSTFHGFKKSLIPAIRPVFSNHGQIKKDIVGYLGLNENVFVNYKAGDQLDNAYRLQVMEPGEVAATAGTSGVIYAVTDKPLPASETRVNSFIHVNHTEESPRYGVLLCINGCGSAYFYLRKQICPGKTYGEMNALAAQVAPGSDGLLFLPFGNGAERMLENKNINASFIGLDFNRHGNSHMIRAVQEGIAYSFRYGLDIMRENQINPAIIRANRTNMFQSELFSQIFSDVTNTSLELAGDGNARIEPKQFSLYNKYYEIWKRLLVSRL